MRRALPVVLVAAVFACFLPVLGNDFVAWDDDLNLTENPSYRGLGPSHLAWMFTTVHGGHYQPLSWVTLGLDYTLWGMNPVGYHLTNLCLHAANAALVYAVLLALVGRERVLAAAVGALFFAVHPLRVESVAWASERRDMLSGFFWLLAVLAYLRAQRGERSRRLALSLGSFVASLLSKAWGITLPVVLLIADIFPLGRFGDARERRRALGEKVPYILLAVAAAAVAFGAVRPIGATRTLAEHGLLARTAQAAYGLCFYLWKTVVPLRLSPLYLLDLRLDPARPLYVAAMLAVAGITAALVLARRRCPWALAAWAGYVVIVSPVLGFVQTGPQVAADRYTYLACLPWAALVAAAARRRAVALAALVPIAALGVLTFRQTGVWRDSSTLWEYVVHIDPTNYVAYTNRGYTREARGDHDGALADYDTAIRLHPGYALAWYNRGTERHARGDVQGAIADLTVSIRLNPRDPRAWNNRGWAREKQGDVNGAAADYADALRAAPPDFPGRALIEENLAAMRALGAR